MTGISFRLAGNHYRQNLHRLLGHLRSLLLCYLIGLGICLIFRLMVMFSFGDHAELKELRSDVFHAFLTGFRFDTTAVTYLFLPLLLVFLIRALIPVSTSQPHGGRMEIMARIYATIVLVITFLLNITDYFYFSFFQTHFTAKVFGILDDDTSALLFSIWHDFPVVWVFLGMVAVSLFSWWMTGRIYRKSSSYGNLRTAAIAGLVIAYLAAYGIGLRGSFETKPISRDEDMDISSSAFVNELTLNGIFALREAFADYGNMNMAAGTDTCYNAFYFHTPEEFMTLFARIPSGEFYTDSMRQYLFGRTPENPLVNAKRPNVIVILMESLSNFSLTFQSPTFQLLGSLEEELPHCIVFRNFFPYSDLTVNTVEKLLTSTPVTPLSISPYASHRFSSSVVLPFKQAGYHSLFITAGKPTWRNMNSFVMDQGFDLYEASPSILANVPGSYTCHWGVPDEFLFERILQKLDQDSDSANFIFAMTISNHIPYDIPDDYAGPQLVLADTVRAWCIPSENELQPMFRAEQYANDCLGKFLHALRSSSYGENTIVLVTGDHNVQNVFRFSDEMLFWRFSVPCLIYIPPSLKPAWKIDASVFGSHQDIFPTLYHLALSDATYFRSGRNLLSEHPDTYGYACWNDFIYAGKEGCIVLKRRKKPVYFIWKDPYRNTLRPLNISMPEPLKEMFLRARAASAAKTYYLLRELEAGNSPAPGEN